jgi:HPt (histidine-containing phosphotransfer) domain-containing protein
MDKRASAQSRIDPVAMERLRRLGGEELVLRMIHLFTAYAAPLVDQAEKDLREGNFDGIERAGHSLKSSAGNVGATDLGRIAAEIERVAAGRNKGPLEKLVPELRLAFDQAVQELDRERNHN